MVAIPWALKGLLRLLSGIFAKTIFVSHINILSLYIYIPVMLSKCACAIDTRSYICIIHNTIHNMCICMKSVYIYIHLYVYIHRIQMNTGRLTYKSLTSSFDSPLCLRIVHIPNLHCHRVSTWKLRKKHVEASLRCFQEMFKQPT